jgi:CHAT domain-containing protein
VPFAALQDAKGDYLIEQHTISVAPSIEVLALTEQQQQRLGGDRRLTSRDNLLIVGNPTMPSLPQTRLAPLPGAEQEAIAIANFFRTRPLLGSAATESTVVQQMQNARLIHLATHGLLNYGADGTTLPELPGAIALAPGNQQDGLLTSTEILNLKLKAQLVVLSACDTGGGEITGDGVIGLSRSLISAGVPSVIVSLWAVPDAPTADLMTQFYRQLQQTSNKAQALRQAMLTTMEQHPDPRSWAAFTLIGEAE